MNKVISIAILITVIVAFTQCSTLSKINNNLQPNVLSGDWKISKWRETYNVKAAFPVGVPVFKIDSDKGLLNVTNGCNLVTAQIRHNSSSATLQFYALESNRLFCNTTPELELIDILSRVNKYEVNENSLKLKINNDIIIIFERKN